nr:interleukin-15 receptor subunit alpha isoform X1 [Anser cygnoides]
MDPREEGGLVQEGGCDGVCSRTVFAGFVMGIPIVLPSLLTSRSHPHHAPVPTTFPSLLSSRPHRHHAPIPIMLPSLSPLLSRSQTHCAPVPVATMLLSPSCSHLCPPLPPRSQSHCHHRSSPVTVVLLSPLFSHPHHCNPNPVVLVLLPTPRSRPRRTAAAAGRFPEPLGRIRTSPTASTPGGHQPRGHHQTLLQPSIAPGIPPCQTCPIPGGTAPSVPRSRASTPCITSRPRPGARPRRHRSAQAGGQAVDTRAFPMSQRGHSLGVGAAGKLSPPRQGKGSEIVTPSCKTDLRSELKGKRERCWGEGK